MFGSSEISAYEVTTILQQSSANRVLGEFNHPLALCGGAIPGSPHGGNSAGFD